MLGKKERLFSLQCANRMYDIRIISCNDPPSLGGVECREVHATFFIFRVGTCLRERSRVSGQVEES